MLAFHNDTAIKEKYLTRVAAHRAADELIHGTGWSNGKGCAIGCTLENYDHSRYPIELGIPEILARLEDCIFEGLKNGKAQEWPERFLSAIRPGADLSRVGWQFLHWLLTRSGIGSYDHPIVKDAVAQCAEVLLPLTRGDPVDESAWSAAESAASAAASAASAAESAASAASAAESAASAWSAASAAWSAWSAARSAAWSAAESAAESAWSAAESARSAAESAWSAAESAAESAASAAWETMADQLIELLEAAP